MAARDVGNVDNADDVEVLVELGEEIAFSNLVVEKIVEKLKVGSADGTYDFETFEDGGQEIFWIFQRVDIFEKDTDFFCGGEFGGALQRFHAGVMHLLVAEAGNFVA